MQNCELGVKSIMLRKSLLILLGTLGLFAFPILGSDTDFQDAKEIAIGDTGSFVNVTIDGVTREVPPYFLSVAFGAPAIMRDEIFLLASSERFLNLASGLSPAILRFGGTRTMYLFYDPDAKDLAARPLDFNNIDNTQNYTMTPDHWSNLTYVAKTAGMDLLFDINQIYRDVEWIPDNARLIFRDAAARGDAVIWQLGNEPNSYRHKFGLEFNGSLDAKDFNQFHQELTDFFNEPGIVGPDVTKPSINSEMEGYVIPEPNLPSIPFLEDFLRDLDFKLKAISWHHYYIDGDTATLDDFLSVEVLDYLSLQMPQVVDVRDRLAPETSIWLTETASAYGGGAAGLSNKYADGFSWLDKLGMSAVMGLDAVVRQTLHNGNYALVSSDIDPRPSYWLSWVYKNIVGGGVLNITLEGASPTTRLYAHCQKSSSPSYKPGNIVIFGMNLEYIPVDIKIEGISSHHSIEQYLLEPENGDLQSGVVLLNGEALEMTPEDQLPPLCPKKLTEQYFEIPPTSYGFWVAVDAGVEAC